MVVNLVVATGLLVTFSSGATALRGNFCGQCSSTSGVKCIDETTFAICDTNGKATNRILTCPAGLKCVNSMKICADVDVGECVSKCGKCENGRFACIGLSAFSLCFGRNETSNVSAKCALGKVCSTAKFDPSSIKPNLDFCFNEVELEYSEIDCFKYQAPTFISTIDPILHVQPSTPVVPIQPELPTPVTSQPDILPHVARQPELPPFVSRQPELPPIEYPVEVPEQDPNIFCRNKRIGKYQILSDRKCQRYYFCYHNGHQMVGKILTCAEHSVFNPTSQKCVRSSLGFYLLHKCGGIVSINGTTTRNEYTSWNYSPPLNAMSSLEYIKSLNEMRHMGLADPYSLITPDAGPDTFSHHRHPTAGTSSIHQRYPLNYGAPSSYIDTKRHMNLNSQHPVNNLQFPNPVGASYPVNPANQMESTYPVMHEPHVDSQTQMNWMEPADLPNRWEQMNSMDQVPMPANHMEPGGEPVQPYWSWH